MNRMHSSRIVLKRLREKIIVRFSARDCEAFAVEIISSLRDGICSKIRKERVIDSLLCAMNHFYQRITITRREF